MQNAKAQLAPYSHSASASASGSLLDVQMNDYKEKKGLFDHASDTAMTGTAEAGDKDKATPSSWAASLASGSVGTWNKRKPLSPREIMLRPLNVELPEPKEDEALFLPSNADRLWYLGYLKPWPKFNAKVIEFWKNKNMHGAFDDLKAFPICPPAMDSDITPHSLGTEVLYSKFRREVLDVLQNVFNKLMDLSRLQRDNVPDELFQGTPDEEDIGNDDVAWEPSYIIKTSGGGNDEAVRILGQAEYLGGREGALTWAVKEVSRNSWGSLRCVLGEISQYMLMSSNKFGFVVSGDEIMFLKLEVEEKVEYNTHDDRDPVTLFFQPWISYSDPINLTDIFDEDEGTVSVRIAMLYLISCSISEDWELPADIGSALNFAAKTKAGEGYVAVLSHMKNKKIEKVPILILK